MVHRGARGLPSPCCALAWLLLCRLYGSFAGPIHVDPHETAVWGKNVTLKCLIEFNEAITQISWEKSIGKTTQTIVVHHPIFGTSFEESYQNRTIFKNTSLHDATIVINNVGFSDAGEYICKAVTFPLGTIQSATTVTVLVEPTVSITKGPNSLMDGANETVAAICTAATGKPAAEVSWEEALGKAEVNSTTFANKTVTVISQYKLVPTRFARRRNITCVVKHPALENDIRYPFTLDIKYAPEVSVTGYDGNWFVGRKNVQLKCNADANPPPTEIKWTRLDGVWPEGLLSVNNTLYFNYPVTHNVSGIYVCRVTNALGQKSDQKIITVLDPPATTPPPTSPQTHSSIDITGLATTSRKFHIPASTMATMQDGNFGTIIGSVVGGCLFLILIIVLFGVIYHRRKQTFRDYPLKDTTSLTAAVAIIGAVLALFLMTVFIVVLLTPRKNQASYLDTIIELPPTHKPYPAFEDHLVSVLGREYLCKLKDQKNVNHEMDLRSAENSSPCLSSSYSAACYQNEPYEELKPRQVHFPRKQYYL